MSADAQIHEVLVLLSTEQLPVGIHTILPAPGTNIQLIAIAANTLYWRDASGWHEAALPVENDEIVAGLAAHTRIFVSTRQGHVWSLAGGPQPVWETSPHRFGAAAALYGDPAGESLFILDSDGVLCQLSPDLSEITAQVHLPFAPDNDVGLIWRKAGRSRPAPAANAMNLAPPPPKIGPVEAKPAEVVARRQTKKRRPKKKAAQAEGSQNEVVARRRLSQQVTISAHKKGIRALLSENSGDTFLTAGGDGWIRRWRQRDLAWQHGWPAHSGGIVALAPIGSQHLATYGDDMQLRVWNLTTGALARSWVPDGLRVTALCATPEGEGLLIADENGALTHWHWPSGESLTRFDCHKRLISAVQFTPKGAELITASNDQTLACFTWPDMTLRQKLTGHSDWVNALAVSTAGDIGFSGSDDQTIIKWSLAQGAAAATLGGHEGWVRHLSLSPNGQWLLSSAFDGKLIVWETGTGQVQDQIELSEAAGAVAWESDTLILVGDTAGRLLRCQWAV